MRITDLETIDLRFPTSRAKDGSDAMNPDPDYSAAYVILRCDEDGAPEGHGFSFTIGRGNDIVVAAIEALRPLVVGLDLDAVWDDPAGFWRRIVGDSQLRWIGPEKGAIHLAGAAVVNAVWDLLAKRAGKPLWKLLVDLEPEQLVGCIDFRHIRDALTPEEAVELLREVQAGKADREAEMRRDGFPAYTTSAGWLGYPEDKVRRLCREALDQGFDHFKIKVGQDLEEDRRRAALLREEIGPDRTLMMDANQVWEVDEAITWMRALAEFDPHWIEEPLSPDDVLGHAAVSEALAPDVGVATGEHVQNRVMFKQFLQAGGMQFCQLDACRLGGVNEVLAVLLLARRFGVPVCPHAGGVGLCEYVQHLSIFDYIAVTGDLDGRLVEFVDHLHEHFVEPVRIADARYQVPQRPGYSAEMHAETLERFRFPDGPEWEGASPWTPPAFAPQRRLTTTAGGAR
jgi:L-fuconate dehydratase